jgi:hypoxanthine phosphoribosyltransferase
MKYYNPTFDEIVTACDTLATQILQHYNNTKPDYLIGLQRGGLIPAVKLSHLLNVPLKVADYSHPNSAGDNKHTHNLVIPEFPPHTKRIVLVDDIIDTANSVNGFLNHLQLPNNCEIILVALYYKDSAILSQPIASYIWRWLQKDAPFVNFPWENDFKPI